MSSSLLLTWPPPSHPLWLHPLPPLLLLPLHYCHHRRRCFDFFLLFLFCKRCDTSDSPIISSSLRLHCSSFPLACSYNERHGCKSHKNVAVYASAKKGCEDNAALALRPQESLSEHVASSCVAVLLLDLLAALQALLGLLRARDSLVRRFLGIVVSRSSEAAARLGAGATRGRSAESQEGARDWELRSACGSGEESSRSAGAWGEQRGARSRTWRREEQPRRHPEIGENGGGTQTEQVR